jgi:ectoine hydroxylase-related dioxygenase (phytanoyl-CoA dioxygenase family)
MHVCTAHFYLSDITAELCPTMIIRGGHKSGRYPQRHNEVTWHGRSAEPVLCRAGDVLFFRSDLWHSGSKNTTADQVRYLLQVHYGRRQMAQHFAPYLQWRFNPAVLAACNKSQLRLLGDHRQGAYD